MVALDDLRWPWVLPVVGGMVLVLLLWWLRRPRSRRRADDLLVADTAVLRTLPRYRALVRRQRALGALLSVGALITVAAAGLALARPQVVETLPREAESRDIMLCLDASASMDADNLAVVRAMQRIVDGLRGDRIGMMIWSASALLVFPLTDDTAYVSAQLDRAETAFAGDPAGFYAGLDAPQHGSSLIGDGIVSCVQRFGPREEDRARALVVSSDDDPVGTPVYPIEQAAQYAAQRDVLVYGIGASVLSRPDRAGPREEFAAATAATGGTLVLLGEDGDADRLVQRVDDLERARASEPPRQVTRDDPTLAVHLGVVGVGVLALGWLLQLLAGLGARPRRAREVAA